MLNAAGLGVAFNAKPVVGQAAHTTVNFPFLDTVPLCSLPGCHPGRGRRLTCASATTRA